MNLNDVFEPALSSPKLDNHEDVVYTNAIQNGNKNDDPSYTPIPGFLPSAPNSGAFRHPFGTPWWSVTLDGGVGAAVAK